MEIEEEEQYSKPEHAYDSDDFIEDDLGSYEELPKKKK